MKVVEWYKKNNLENILFFTAWTLFLLSLLCCCTAWWTLNLENGDGMFSVVTRVMKYFAAFLCCIVILFSLIQKKYNLQAIIGYGLLAVVFAISAYFSKNTYIFSYWFFFAAAYRQSAKKILTISTFITAVFLFTVIICAFFGFAVDMRWGAEERHALGFSWCTTGPILFFFFMLQYIVLRKEKIKVWEFAILEAVNIWFFYMTETEMAFYLSSAFLVFFAFQSLFKNHWKILSKMKWLWIILPVIIFIAAILLHDMYNPEVPFLYWLNDRISHRLELGKSGIDMYGFTLFGQPIEWVGFSVAGIDGIYNYVDCSYLQIMLEFGIVTVCAVVAIYILAIYNASKVKNYWVVFAMLFAMILSVTEPRLMNMEFNILPILAFVCLEEKGFQFRRKIEK